MLMTPLYRALRAMLAVIVAMCVIGSATAQTPVATPEVDAGPLFLLKPTDDVDGAYFTVEAEAGTTTTLSATLGNIDDEPLTLRTFRSNAVTLVNGGFGVEEEDAEVSEPASWITWQAETITFQPGSGIEREFTVSIPEGTPPGQYIAGISLQTAEPMDVEGSSMFKQILRKSVAVLIIVPGDVTPAFELGEPSIDTSTPNPRLVVPVVNSGNVLVKPSGPLTITDASGTDVLAADIQMGSVYAGHETTLEIPLDPGLADQDLTVNVHLADEATSAEATVADATLQFSSEAPAQNPVSLSTFTVTPMPDSGDIQFALIDVSVTNGGNPVQNATVVLTVKHNGELVEELDLASAMTLQGGENTIQQRYIPLEGWSEGEWSFEITVNTISSDNRATTRITGTTEPVVIQVEGE